VFVLLASPACSTSGVPTAARATTTPTGATTTSSIATTTSTVPRTTAPACAEQHGAVSTQTIGGDGNAIRVAAYLPPCATDGSGRRFRTVYLLHGGNADETQWPAIGLAQVADELIATGEIRPVIVVMPDSGLDAGDTTITDSVVPWADRNLPTSARRDDRAVGGISAGGAAAIALVVAHPDLFSRLGGHSPVVDVTAGDVDRLAAWPGQIWLDVGASDGLRADTAALANRLTAAGANPDLHVWPGQHDRAYWGAHVAEYLRFYGS
jgi:enterochelin esterase-like enzyme